MDKNRQKREKVKIRPEYVMRYDADDKSWDIYRDNEHVKSVQTKQEAINWIDAKIMRGV